MTTVSIERVKDDKPRKLHKDIRTEPSHGSMGSPTLAGKKFDVKPVWCRTCGLAAETEDTLQKYECIGTWWGKFDKLEFPDQAAEQEVGCLMGWGF